jgi:predicted GIY-YIG superfamily endonuclease
MNFSTLNPQPTRCEAFKRNRERFVPPRSGCYVLTTFSKDVLYLGLTVNLRRRMNEHLDDSEKTSETKLGRAVFFFWLELNTNELNKVERTWQNIHIQYEGKLPALSKVYSPTST